MKIQVSREIDQHELDCLCECVYEATGNELDNEELLELFESFPIGIRVLAVYWGMNDTGFRDEVYEYLRGRDRAT